MFEYVRRLATTGAAYTAASIVSKLIAVFLLPVYTAYLSPADYGAAEVMLASLVAASIVVRLGVIEAILRFYYLAGENQDEVVRTSFASLFWTTTAIALVALGLAAPISQALLGHPDAGLARLAVLGLWQLTLWEFALTLLRLDERAKAYFGLTIAAVAVTIPITVALVVGTDLGASAILLGSFGTGTVFLLWRLWVERRRLGLLPDRPLLRRMLRFGLPTMPAELTIYSLNFIDRIILVRYAGLAEAGIYALAVKFGNGMQVLVRGFHLAWPPLAYSIEDDDEASRAYALIVTWFVAISSFAVVGLWILAPWMVRLLADDRYYAANEAIGPLAAGIGLYSLYLVMVVILGRTGRTERSFPATAAGVIANVGLNLWLVPDHGVVGAAVALVLSYVVVVGLMYGLTRNLFPVPYQWRRLGLISVATVAPIAVAETLVSHEGAVGLIESLALCASYPLILHLFGFLSSSERTRIKALLDPAALSARFSDLRASESGAKPIDPDGSSHTLPPEVYEQATRDADRGGN